MTAHPPNFANGHDHRGPLQLPPDHRRTGPPGAPRDAARGHRHAPVHAGRHAGDGQGADAWRPPAGRRPDHSRQHLPPQPAARRRAHRAPRWAACVHGLGRTDPHRLGRLPGLQPRASAPRSTTTGSPSRSHLDGRRTASPRNAPSRSRSSSAPTSRWLSTSWSARRSRRARWRQAMERTHRWAARCLAARTRSGMALFGIIQGGIDRALRATSARSIAGMPFDGLAIGGMSVGESKDEMAEALEVVADTLGDDGRVRYLMGVGSPVDFFTAVERGDRPVRLRPSHPGRPQRPALDERGTAQPPERALPGRSRAGRPGMRLRDLPEPFTRLPGASLPGR